MNMQFYRKLPIPMEIKEQFPASEEIKNTREKCISEMNDIFSGKSDKFILVIGPCSADREDAVLDYIYRLRGVQDKVSDKISELMKEMFSSYCRLVSKHSTASYSPIVKKTVMLIDSDISAELSLATLAEAQGISGGYLATLFKKETGKTISEYIRDRRIEHAKYLLNTTHLQIQTVALHCGIMDVQYFSKIFKKQIGKTPKEYREDAKK